jgi:hypothetical protein
MRWRMMTAKLIGILLWMRFLRSRIVKKIRPIKKQGRRWMKRGLALRRTSRKSMKRSNVSIMKNCRSN